MNGLLDFILNPICVRRDAHDAMLAACEKHLTSDMSVYDVGCGPNPFKPLMTGRVKEYVGVDIADGFYDASHIDLVGSAYGVPLEDGRADAVVSSQVLEHLEKPFDALKETNRILRPGGFFVLSWPFLYPLHAKPIDFFRYTEYGMRAMLEAEGFEIVETRRLGGLWYCMGVFIGIYLSFLDKPALRKFGIYQAIIAAFKWAFYALDRLEFLLCRLAGKDPDLYRQDWPNNYIFVARKTGASQGAAG